MKLTNNIMVYLCHIILVVWLCGCDTANTGSASSSESTGGVNIAGETAGASAGQTAGTEAGIPAGTEAGESAGTQAGETAGEVAGTDAGEMAGEVAGTNAGEIAGTDAGEAAGEAAGEVAGTDAGTDAGEAAGEVAGTDAGEDAGEVAGTEAGEAAGEVAGTEAGEVAGTEAGDMAGTEAGTDEIESDLLEDELSYLDSLIRNSSNLYYFTVTETSAVLIQTTGADGMTCPAGTDTTINLARIENDLFTDIDYNDDANDLGLCSRITRVLEAGTYVVEVQGFGGSEIPEYLLTIAITPLLNENEACTTNYSLGICDTSLDLTCIDDLCQNGRGSITSLSAYKEQGAIYLVGEVTDLNEDSRFITLSLLDANGERLVLDEFGQLEYFDFLQTNYVESVSPFRYTKRFENVDLAVSVEMIIGSFNDDSEPVVTELLALPRLAENSVCELVPFTGVCDEGLICQIDNMSPDTGVCSMGIPPVATQAQAYLHNGQLIVSVDASDENQDIEGIELVLYNQNGETIDVDPNQFTWIAQRDILNSDDMRYFIQLAVDETWNLAALEARAYDVSGLSSAWILVPNLSPLPLVDVGAECDVDGLSNACTQDGICADQPGADQGICIDSLPTLNESCNPAGAGCEEGLTCYSSANGGDISSLYNQCLRNCNAHLEDTGCLEDEICVPDIDWASFGFPDEPSPGVCVADDACIPGDELASCGGDAFSCLRYESVSLCIESDVIEALPNTAGVPCLNGLCAPGFVCELNLCRAACVNGNECGDGEECLDLSPRMNHQNTYRMCMPQTCDLINQDCPEEGETCAIIDELQGQVVTECISIEDGELVNGDACMTDNAYWGDCTGAHICAELFAGNGDECLAFCSQDNASACAGEQACINRFFNAYDEVGICFGECNVFNGNGCEPGSSCLLVGAGTNSANENKIAGLCVVNSNDENLGTGETCVLNDLDNTSNCAEGHICAALQVNGPSVCVELCQENNPEANCTGLAECLTEVPLTGEPIFGEDLVGLGICLE